MGPYRTNARGEPGRDARRGPNPWEDPVLPILCVLLSVPSVLVPILRGGAWSGESSVGAFVLVLGLTRLGLRGWRYLRAHG